MKYLITTFLTLLFISSKSQDSLSYKRTIDNQLNFNSKRPLRKLIKEGTTSIYYCYNRKTKQLEHIDVITKYVPESMIWVHQFSFINSELVRICKWNNKGTKSKDRKIAFYYLDKDGVVYREENLTKIDDIENEREKGIQLAANMPSHY